MPLALLSALRVLESPLGNPRIVPQGDRRQKEERRKDWRGGRRVSDFSQFATLNWVTSAPESGKSTTEGILH